MTVTRATGTFRVDTSSGEPVRTFVPAPLPPDPPLTFAPEDEDLLERTNRALGRLDGLTVLLPDPQLFLYFYVRKEAVLSSQIEGTQSSFSDLLMYESAEAPGVPLSDVKEVSRYVAAMQHGLARLRGGFPLSLRLIREIHSVLLTDGRGNDKQPGEFRGSQNWLGGTRPGLAKYVPPPPHKVMECLSDFEKFLHNEKTGTLIKAALCHVQFETIHPFLDGNGRLGRLLITFLLCAEHALQDPSLYLSPYFKTHRQEYYDWLQAVRLNGDWEGWIRFFLSGVLDTSNQAVETTKKILALFDDHRKKIALMGRASLSALRVQELLQRKPVTSISDAAKQLGLSEPTIASSLERLQKAGLVTEATGKQRGQIFVYTPYVKLLSDGTEPLR
jgi:Fic family protein